MTLPIIIIILCVIAEGFFSGSEIAIVNANRMLLNHRAQEGHLGSRIASQFLQKPEMLLGSTLVGTNLCTVTGTVTLTLLMIEIFGESAEYFAVLFFWPLTFLFGEIIPKTIYQANADRIAPYCAMLLRIFILILYPVIWVFTRFSNLLIRILKEKSTGEPVITRSDLKALANTKDENEEIDREERRMIRRTVDFANAKVSDVMVPLIDVVALEQSTTSGDAANFSLKHSYSRYPIYKERVDQIVGIVDTYTLLRENTPSESVRGCMIKPFFVPESMTGKALMGELRHKGIAMAIVVDEYGGAVGIVTIEDILEEILGDINDEFDTAVTMYRKIGQTSYVFHARAETEFINEQFDFEVPDGEYETLGGYLLELFDRIPKHEESLLVAGIRYTVLHPTDRNLTEVRVDILNVGDKTNR